MQGHYDDDEKDDRGPGKKRFEFDCPECNANNPYDDGFGADDEIRCYYCGLEFKVQVTEEGRFRFREI